MTTLGLPRLHFHGRFYTDPSTQNNRAAWFEPDADLADDPHRQNWNPVGLHVFELRGCVVGAARGADGVLRDAAGADRAVGGSVTTPRGPGGAFGRMVDLDPAHQLAPQLWGVQVRVAGTDGLGLTAALETATLGHLKRRSEGPADEGMSGTYTSHLAAPTWDDGLTGVLGELRARSPGRLAIAFTVYRYVQAKREGRVVGTIGPATAERTPPRVLVGQPYDARAWGVFEGMADTYPIRFRHGPVPAEVDDARGVLVLDLGDGLLEAVDAASGALTRRDYGALVVGAERLTGDAVEPETTTFVGALPLDHAAYERTAGVHEVALSPEVRADPAAWRLFVESAVVGRILAERADGLRVEASARVVRLDPPRPGEAAQEARVALRVRAFGAPAAGLPLQLVPRDPAAVGLEHRLEPARTDADGRASIVLVPGDPGRARGAVDGRVFFLLFGLSADPSAQLDDLVVRVFDRHPLEPTWENVGPILRQYARLYPRMAALASPDAVRGLLGTHPRLLLDLPLEDPRHMPVTRDLSRDRREALLAWIAAGAPGPTPEP